MNCPSCGSDKTTSITYDECDYCEDKNCVHTSGLGFCCPERYSGTKCSECGYLIEKKATNG